MQSWPEFPPGRESDIIDLHSIQAPQGLHARDKNLAAILSSCQAMLLRNYTKLRPGAWMGAPFSLGSLEPKEKPKRLGLHQCLELASEPTTGLSPHSFSIGAMSEAARKGAAEAQLQMMGQWRSNAYMRYVRPTPHMPT